MFPAVLISSIAWAYLIGTSLLARKAFWELGRAQMFLGMSRQLCRLLPNTCCPGQGFPRAQISAGCSWQSCGVCWVHQRPNNRLCPSSPQAKGEHLSGCRDIKGKKKKVLLLSISNYKLLLSHTVLL